MPAERIVPSPDVRELLVGRRPRPVRPRLGAVLRPGRGPRLRRAGLRSRLQPLRALPRVLEPRLHGVRAARRRDADPASCAEHRHRARPRARGGGSRGSCPCTRRTATRDHGVDRRRVRRGVRRLPGRDEGPPRPRRPRARDDVPRRRPGHAVERGPRLRPPSHHPSRGPAGAADRARGRPPPPSPSSWPRWPAPTRAGRLGGADRGRRARGGGAIRGDARAGTQAVREPGRERVDLRRGGVHARRDLRVPARAHRRARGGAGPARRRRRLPDGDGAPPRGLQGPPGAATSSAPPISRARRVTSEFVGYAKTDVLTQIGALEEVEDGLFLAKLRESPFYAAGGGQVTDQGRSSSTTAPGRGRARRGVPLRGRSGALPPGTGSPRETACAPSSPGTCGSRRWRTTRGRTSCTGAARRPRRARPPGGLGGAAGQAPLRLHARARSTMGRRRRGARVNEHLRRASSTSSRP